MGKSRETAKQQDEQVELVIPKKATCRCMENWAIALQGIASEDGDLYRSLGPCKKTALTHQTTEWNLDAMTLSLFRHHEGVWTNHV
jgi:hypothetical protein